MHHPFRHFLPRAAFTLAELAIVLVVIGLLVGAVVGGAALLRQSELQTVVADYTRYSNAAAQFTQAYGGPPGDILDATNYWGTNVTYCTVVATNNTPGTCNGNGDGQILTAQPIATIPNTNEVFRAWQHLMLAKLIDGNYSGVAGSGGALQAVIGTNIPKSRVTNAGWSFYYKAVTSADTDFYNQDLSNYLFFGSPVTNGLTQGAALTSSDAWQVDKKMDDALPASGRVMALKPSPSTITPNCTTSVTDASAQYNLAKSGILCSLLMSITLK